VKKHAKEPWTVLYIERWLQAPVQEQDGQLVPRERGTPQGGVISPLLANLFLHYVFDRMDQHAIPAGDVRAVG
jgi:retron-type reverse transcriptase